MNEISTFLREMLGLAVWYRELLYNLLLWHPVSGFQCESQLLWCTWESCGRCLKYLGPCYLCGKPASGSGLLISIRPILDAAATEYISVSLITHFSLSLCCSDFQIHSFTHTYIYIHTCLKIEISVWPPTPFEHTVSTLCLNQKMGFPHQLATL